MKQTNKLTKALRDFLTQRTPISASELEQPPPVDMKELLTDCLQRREGSRKQWRRFFLSLPADIVIFYVFQQTATEADFARFTEIAIYFLMALVFLSFLRGEIVSALISLQGFQKNIETRTKHITPYLAYIIPLIVIIDIAMKMSGFGIVPVVIFFLIITTQFQKIRNQLIKQTDSLEQSETLLQYKKAEFIHEQLSGVTIASFIVLRAASALSAVYLSIAGLSDFSLLIHLTIFGLLFALSYPEDGEFIVNCKRCGITTSRAFRDTFSCPACALKRYKQIPS